MTATLSARPSRVFVPEEGARWLEGLKERLSYEAAIRGLRRGQAERMGEPSSALTFIAEILPDEGLDYILNIFPRNVQAIPATLYMGLFSSQSATTCPASTAVMATQTGVTELTNAGGYARAALAAATWPAGVISGSGLRTTLVAPGVSFAQSAGAFNATANGFFLATSAVIGAGIAICYANFSDGIGIAVNSAGFTIRVQNYLELDG